MSEARRLVENLVRLREHAEAVRAGSPTVRDDLATVLHLLIGGDGVADGYGVVQRALDELGLDQPRTPGWGTDVPGAIDGEPVLLALRGSPTGGPPMTLEDRLSEACLRFAIPGTEPATNWSYRDLIKKVRNKFGSHVDKKPPQWLEELRYYPAGDADAVTYLLWRAAEEVAAAVCSALDRAGCDVEPFDPPDTYLNGVDLTQAYVLGAPGTRLDVRAQVRCESWQSGARRAVVGARFGKEPFVFGLEGDGRLALATGAAGGSVAELARDFVQAGMPKAGRNDLCPCGGGRKFKYCHGR